jgi:hypothetical protein
MKTSTRVVPVILMGTVLFSAGIFWVSGNALERRVVQAEPVAEVRQEAGAFVAVKDRRIDRLAVRAIRDGRVYALEDHFLYVSDDYGETFQQKGVLPKVDPSLSDRLRDLVARHPVVRRIRQKAGPPNVVVLSSGTILVFYDHVYRSEDGGQTFAAVGEETLRGVSSPFAHGVAVDGSDRIFFGEYRVRQRPQTIRVLIGEDDGRQWRICHTFDEGEIFHVHSVTYDRFDDRLVIATGDRDDESGLFTLDPDCNGIEPIGGGDQRWRAIAPLYTATEVIWGSDDTSETGSHMFSKRRGSQDLEHRRFIGNAPYYAAELTDGTLVTSTTFSPDSRYGRAHPEELSAVLISRDGIDWWTLAEYPWLEEELSWGRSRAQAALTAGDGTIPFLFVTPIYTKEGFVTYRYQITWDNSP